MGRPGHCGPRLPPLQLSRPRLRFQVSEAGAPSGHPGAVPSPPPTSPLPGTCSRTPALLCSPFGDQTADIAPLAEFHVGSILEGREEDLPDHKGFYLQPRGNAVLSPMRGDGI